MENNDIFKTIATVNVANPKVSEQIKNLKNNFNSYTPKNIVIDNIMYNTNFSLRERFRILYDVSAYLYGIEVADSILIATYKRRWLE